MTSPVHGIHHITAIASDPQATYDFYTQVLGLRLVKKSVNQDDVQTYHLFFGDRVGEPGMDLTFFTFQPLTQGVRGNGQVTTISLVVPRSSLQFWEQRFDKYGVRHEKIEQAFGQELLSFYDQDEQRLELVGVNDAELPKDTSQVWATTQISTKHAIRSFHSAKLSVASLSLIEPILTHILGYEVAAHHDNVTLFCIPGGERAAYLEVEESPESEQGITGVGTVHHIAFEVDDEAVLRTQRDRLLDLGLYPTTVINRFYFKSVYFRTPAGILFELATSGPGFTADETEKELGKKLALPPFLEGQRREIEAGLTPITPHES
jgi:glyoxalase family protein